MSRYTSRPNPSIENVELYFRVCKTVFKDSKVCMQMTCGKTKSTMIAKTLGATYKTDALETMKTRPFTLMIDESNDHGSNKVLAVLIRAVVDQPTTKFVTLLPCNIGTAEYIFGIMSEFFRCVFSKSYN